MAIRTGNHREFDIETLTDYARAQGYILEFSRYKHVFTLRRINNPEQWGWIYSPRDSEQLVANIDELDFRSWQKVIEDTIKRIS